MIMLKVMENDDMNMMSGEVNASTLLDFFNQLTSKSSSSLESLPIKVREWWSWWKYLVQSKISSSTSESIKKIHMMIITHPKGVICWIYIYDNLDYNRRSHCQRKTYGRYRRTDKRRIITIWVSYKSKLLKIKI